MSNHRDVQRLGDYPKAGAGFAGPGIRQLIDFQRTPDEIVALMHADEKGSPGRFAKLQGHAGKGLTTHAIVAFTG